MKRINKPTEPMPEIYKSDILQRDDDDLNEVFELKKNDNYDDIPNKQVFNYNLKKLKSFRNIRKSYKIKNLKNIFLNDLSIVLNEYSPQDINNQLNDELLVEIMNISEQYFFYGSEIERDENKNDCIIKLMLPYFRNDERLLLKTISLVSDRVNKSSRIQRLIARLKYFFLSLKIK